jgi:putative FmdB family regulatory protein
MPLFDYFCLDCGESSEVLIKSNNDLPECGSCGSKNLKKLLSAPSSMSGPVKNNLPGPMDTTCCGSSPGQKADCAGPGTCCGKN